MKDSVHHLKHVQKKIIRSARQTQMLEDSSQNEALNQSATTSLLEPPVRSKRKHLNNQLRKSFVRNHVH